MEGHSACKWQRGLSQVTEKDQSSLQGTGRKRGHEGGRRCSTPSRLGGRALIRPGSVWPCLVETQSLLALLAFPLLALGGGCSRAHGPVTCSDTEPQGSLVRVTFLVRGTAGVKPVHDSPAA